MRPCLSDEELFALIDGALPEPDVRVLREHLRACARCAKSVATLERVTTCMAEAHALDVPAHTEAVLAALDRPRRPRTRRRSIPVVVGAMAAAATLLLAVGLALDRRPDEGFTARGGAWVDAALTRGAALTVHVLEGNDVHPLKSGATIAPGARFVASHRNTGKDVAYALVFGVDSGGNIHWLYPAYESRDTDPASVRLEPTEGRDVLMGTSVSFDDLTAGPLSIITVLSRTSLRVSQIEGRRDLSVAALRGDFPQSDVASIDVRVSR